MSRLVRDHDQDGSCVRISFPGSVVICPALLMTEPNHGESLNTNASRIFTKGNLGLLQCILMLTDARRNPAFLDGDPRCSQCIVARGHGSKEGKAILNMKSRLDFIENLNFSVLVLASYTLSHYLYLSNCNIHVRVICTSQFHNFASLSIKRGINSVSDRLSRRGLAGTNSSTGGR